MHDIQLMFRAVAGLTAEERNAYFEEQQVPADTRAEVESLLAFDTMPAQSLTDCVAATVREFLGGTPEPQAGSRCGAYQLLSLLGRGGMGAVFLAERTDGEVEQRVAIKFMRNVAEDPVLRDRFLRERQFLASLNHPGIARLLDAGHTEQGQPYLVMEYVEGVPLDVYGQKLDLRGKLELFLKVADALTYAHRNLVIHRDLKPSNILVGADGQPKLLDFGIARMLDETADPGVTRERLMTPEYASPEQVLGRARTTATDIYSLGAVLYQLLTGRSPHALEPGSDISVEEMICHRETPAPGSVNRAVPRDLDFIVGKALRKEPEERYVAVDTLAEDVRAFLESRPVRARAGNAWYRTRKFMRRHWVTVAATSGAILFLALGLYATNRQRTIAQHRFQQLRQLANKVLEFDPDIRELPGSTSARQKIVSVSMAYLDGLSREAAGDPELALELANGFLQLAKVQGVPAYANLGQFSEAEVSLGKAETFAANALRADAGRPDALELAAEIAECRMMVADVQRRDADVLKFAGQSAGRLQALAAGRRASQELLRDSVSLELNVGQAYMNQHHFEEAVRYAQQGVELAKTTGAATENAAAGLSLVANALRQSGDLDGALQAITESRQVAESTKFTGEVQRSSVLYSILWRQGQILGADDSVSLGRPDDALEPLQKAFDLMEELAGKDPKDTTSRDRVGLAAQQLGDVLRHRDPRRALEVYDRGIARQREIQGPARPRRVEARLLAHSSYPLRELNRRSEAGERIDAALALLRGTKDYPAAEIHLGSETADTLMALADQQSATAQPLRAVATCRELLDKTSSNQNQTDTDLMQAAALSKILDTTGRVNRQAGNTAEATALEGRRLELWRAWQTRLPRNTYIAAQLRLAEKLP